MTATNLFRVWVPLFRLFCASRAVFTLAILSAGWPVIQWYARRMVDGSDEKVGLLGLGLALVFVRRDGWLRSIEARRAWVATGALALYSIGLFFEIPPLLRGAMWIVSLSLAAAPAGKEFSWFIALLFSLPFVTTLQFYLGYPVRWLVTQCAALFLSLIGPTVRVEGLVLNLAGARVLIDAPCAGIQMGWTLSFLAILLALRVGENGKGTCRLLRKAGLLSFLANFVRVCVLFILETRFGEPSENVHQGVGLACFAGAASVLIFRRDVASELPKWASCGPNWANLP